MNLQDEEMIAIDQKLTELKEQKKTIKHKINQKNSLTKKECFTLFFFNLTIFSCFLYLSSLITFYLNYNLDHYPNHTSFSGFFLTGALSTAALISLICESFFNDKNRFQKCFDNPLSFLKTLFIALIVALCLGFCGGFFYAVFIYFVFLFFKSNFDLNVQIMNNFFLVSTFFIFYFFNLKEQIFVSNEKQDQSIQDQKTDLNNDIKLVENEEVFFQQKIIDSIKNLDDYAYFKHFLNYSKTTEISQFQDVIEKNVLKNSPYSTFEAYEKETLKTKINNTLIRND